MYNFNNISIFPHVHFTMTPVTNNVWNWIDKPSFVINSSLETHFCGQNQKEENTGIIFVPVFKWPPVKKEQKPIVNKTLLIE